MTEVHNLGSLLKNLENKTDGDKVSVGDLLNAVGRRSYGPLLLLLGFASITPLTIIPGANWLLALIILLVAGQVLVGKKYPWVPSRFLKVEFPRTALKEGIAKAYPFVCQVDWFLKPRLTFLTAPPFVQVIALICISAALLVFPLGLVPFGPVLPGLTVLLFGLALTARDGFVLIFAGAGLAGAILLVMAMWGRIFG